MVIVGRKGSNACKQLRKALGKETIKNAPRIVVNYGLPPAKLVKVLHNHPELFSTRIINERVGLSKYHMVKLAEQNGILVPRSKESLSILDRKSSWIEKKVFSSMGKGIVKASKRTVGPDKYFQEFIKNRVYELRVHAFNWIRPSDWTIHKRVGDKDMIAWNYHQGGKFKSILNREHKIFKEAERISVKILKIFKMDFGAVDFIVDSDRKIYFIEINSSPGFTDFSKDIYIDAFRRLI